jgi:hypothetical protein
MGCGKEMVKTVLFGDPSEVGGVRSRFGVSGGVFGTNLTSILRDSRGKVSKMMVWGVMRGPI